MLLRFCLHGVWLCAGQQLRGQGVIQEGAARRATPEEALQLAL